MSDWLFLRLQTGAKISLRRPDEKKSQVDEKKSQADEKKSDNLFEISVNKA